ncbi:hypothetical protein CEXT_397351 [Caerostris extrusa]|uniref:Uncharacterized protein n=1 Tax=Caerostris extrusa TaxID=172846 RepID=A0AAV4W3U5_CAEEX|nr:hypothetical protein CEXT_397351 [Caerostris extrusa]
MLLYDNKCGLYARHLQRQINKAFGESKTDDSTVYDLLKKNQQGDLLSYKKLSTFLYYNNTEPKLIHTIYHGMSERFSNSNTTILQKIGYV